MKRTLPVLLFALACTGFAQSPDPALPGAELELVSFTADPTSPRGVLIHWATYMEKGAQRFVVERSSDEVEWTTVAELPAVGNSSRHVTYETWDTHPQQGIAHYRLLEMDQHEARVISEVFTVRVEPMRGLLITPDQAPGRFTVKSSTGNLEEVQLLNNRGQFMPVQLEVRPDQVYLNAELVPAGTYFIQARVDGMPVMRTVLIGGTGSGG